jgi:hypothetical protein
MEIVYLTDIDAEYRLTALTMVTSRKSLEIIS